MQSDYTGCSLLDVDPENQQTGCLYFCWVAGCCRRRALSSARVARKLIDMRKQHGEHPRMGAMDVCPFVPVANVSMQECVELAKRLANEQQ